MSVTLERDTYSFSYGYGACALSKRRRRYASSEREADFALGLIIRIIIAAFGALLAIVALSNYLVQRRDDDLLEPVKKQSDITFAFSQFPKWTKYGLGLGLALIPTTFVIVMLHQSHYTTLGMIASLISASATFISFIGAVLLLVIAKLRGLKLVVDRPERYKTLFRDGEEVFYDEKNLQNFTTYTIRVPRGMEWNAERSTRFVEQLIHSFAPLLFRIYADDKAIVWQIVDILAREGDQIENAIRISYPEADVHRMSSPPEMLKQSANFYRISVLYRASNEFVFPMKYTSDIRDFDPLTAIVSAMNGLEAGERIIQTIFVPGDAPNAHKKGYRLITKSTISPFDFFTGRGLRRIAALKAMNLERVEKYVPNDQKLSEEKLKNSLYQALFAVQIDSPSKERILALATNVNSQLYGFTRSIYNGLEWYTGIENNDGDRVPPDMKSLIVSVKASFPFYGSLIVNLIELTEKKNKWDVREATKLILGGQEIALLWHLPNENFSASRIYWLSSRTVPPPTAVIHQLDTNAVLLGHGTSGGKLFPIHLPIKDRENHIRIVGKTGVGKSSLMYNMIMQDIRKGYGVAVIDPHGSLVQNILGTHLKQDELARVVLLDLSAPETPPPLNPLRGGLGYVRVGQIIQSIESIYPETKRYPRTSHLLRTALLTLNADPSATLKDVMRLFNDPVYRESLIHQIDDTELRETWELFDIASDKEKRSITDPIRTRMSPFYSNRDLMPIMCHPDTLDFRQMMQEQKIILISLKMDEANVPETERNLIGSLLISRLQVSGMHNQGGIPYFVYIDEVQKFVTSSLDNMFAEARKFGLSLTVAHQYLEQLSDTTQNAIIGNAGASIIFSSSPQDAQTFQTFTRPSFETDDIVNLDQFTAVVKMQCDGVSQPAFTLLTPLPQVENPEDLENIPVFRRRLELDPDLVNSQAFESREFREGHAEAIRWFSSTTYTPKSWDQVNAWLRQRYGKALNSDDQTQFYEAETAEPSADSNFPSGHSEWSNNVTDD